MPVWLIVGASSGIGLELVKQLAARGEKVYATVRSRKNSQTGEDHISAVAATGDVTIIENIDITSDAVGEALTSALSGVTIDALINNAGSLNATRDVAPDKMFEEQKFANITPDRMRAAFELNTLGPLKVSQALMPQLKSPGGKVAIISTGMGSIGDNGSGGIHAYRTSKAAVNMVLKGMSTEVKDKGISCQAIAPGFVATEFAGGKAALEKMGGMPVEKCVKDVIGLVDGMTMENTGKFMCVQKEEVAPKEFPW